MESREFTFGSSAGPYTSIIECAFFFPAQKNGVLENVCGNLCFKSLNGQKNKWKSVLSQKRNLDQLVFTQQGRLMGEKFNTYYIFILFWRPVKKTPWTRKLNKLIFVYCLDSELNQQTFPKQCRISIFFYTHFSGLVSKKNEILLNFVT